MKTKICLAALALSSVVSVQAESLQEALKNGKFYGDINFFATKFDMKHGARDVGMVTGSLNLQYDTASFNNFKASVGFRHSQSISEKYKDDYYFPTMASGRGKGPSGILHTANISYENEYVNLTVGRQPINLEWIGHYHEAAVLNIKAVKDTEIILGKSTRWTKVYMDRNILDFDKGGYMGKQGYGKKGLYFADVKYTGVKGLSLNPYYRNSQDFASWAGLKADYSFGNYGLMAHYAKSNEEKESNFNNKDGSVAHVEARANFFGFNTSLGYIKTDKESGLGSIGNIYTEYDDTFFTEANSLLYERDTRMTYVAVGYPVTEKLYARVIAGDAKFKDSQNLNSKDLKEKEVNLMLSYNFTDNLSCYVIALKTNSDKKANDYNRVLSGIAYTF